MKGIIFSNKDNFNIVESLNRISESFESEIKSRGLDIFTPGVVKYVRPSGEEPFNIVKVLSGSTVVGLKVTPGVAYFNSQPWPYDINIKYSTNTFDKAFERVFLENELNVNIPSFNPNSEYKIFLKLDINRDSSYNIINKDGVLVSPFTVNSIQVYTAVSKLDFNDIYIGKYSSGNIDLSGKEYLRFRDGDFYTYPTNSQRDSHSNGISPISHNTFLFPSIDNINSMDAKVRFLLSTPSAEYNSFYINGYRFDSSSITPIENNLGNLYGYINVPNNTSDVYIYLERDNNNAVSFVTYNSVLDSKDDLLLCSVKYNNVSNIWELTDRRIFGLNGNINYQNNSITEQKLRDSSVTEQKLGDSSVTTAKIANSAVTNSKMADNSVSTSNLINLSITNDKIANATISTEKISDINFTNYIGGINRDKINFSIPDKIRVFVSGTLEAGSLPIFKTIIDKKSKINRIYFSLDNLPVGSNLVLSFQNSSSQIFSITIAPNSTSNRFYVDFTEQGNALIKNFSNDIISNISVAVQNWNLLSYQSPELLVLYVTNVGSTIPGGDDLLINIIMEDINDAGNMYKSYQY